MRKLAILALIYLFCLELAHADSKKDIELEYLKSIAGTSKECFNLNSKTINYKKIINNFKNIYLFYKKIIKIKKPKIGILGLNPHNAIDFSNKTEEKNIISPAIKIIKKRFKLKISGPISPDTSFLVRNNEKLNCLIGIYHDQVITTFKYINKYSAINITLGLPFIRVSPDHGVATNIVGKNKADPKSFLYALNFFEKFHNSI